MSEAREAAIRIPVDPANPGQFFACCGLLELADRLWGGAEGWFDGNRFAIRASEGASLQALLGWFKEARLIEALSDLGRGAPGDDDDENEDLRPIELALAGRAPPLRLDWWGNKSLKPWAGSMDARVIFVAMKDAIDPTSDDPLNHSCVVFDPVDDASTGRRRAGKGRKREPFYFDARRGAASRSLDIGFAPDALQLTSVAFPAAESLALVGLQRCRPSPAGRPRRFDYFTWAAPLTPLLAPAGVNGLLPSVCRRKFRFENAFRTDQRKHKAYCPSTPLQGDHDDRDPEEV